MTTILIRSETAADAVAREDLLEAAFGPARFEKTCERLREGRLPAVALVAEVDGRIVGSVRLWAVAAGPGRPALVLGPLAFDALLAFWPGFAPLEGVLNLARYGVSVALLTIALIVAHVGLPAVRQPLRNIWPGVVLTLVLSVGFGDIFGLYLARFSRNYVTTYAGLASIMIVIVFLYSLAAIFLFGGELNAAIAREARTRAKA